MLTLILTLYLAHQYFTNNLLFQKLLGEYWWTLFFIYGTLIEFDHKILYKVFKIKPDEEDDDDI